MKTEKGTWVPIKMLCGHIAMWAVRQSPYAFPDNLESVLAQCHATAKRSFDDNGMGHFTLDELREFVETLLLSQAEVATWNDRKNGNPNEHKIVSQFDGPTDPDDDFIDLDAFTRNVSKSIWKECQE